MSLRCLSARAASSALGTSAVESARTGVGMLPRRAFGEKGLVASLRTRSTPARRSRTGLFGVTDAQCEHVPWPYWVELRRNTFVARYAGTPEVCGRRCRTSSRARCSGSRASEGARRGLDRLAIGEGFVWVLDTALGTLTPIVETSGEPRSGVPVGTRAEDVAVGFGSVWIASGGDVLEVDPVGLCVTRTIDVGDTPILRLAVDAGEGAIWLDIGAD
jgi:hypothetical protein